jgi:hypothetical protein
MSIRKNKYRVIYTVKNETGYLIEKTQQFPTFADAKLFVSYLLSGGQLIGKPIFEIR